MAQQLEGEEEFTRFTHEIEGRPYSAIYRRIPGLRVEVCFGAKLGIHFLGVDDIEHEARRLLEELVKADELALGATLECGSDNVLPSCRLDSVLPSKEIGHHEPSIAEGEGARVKGVDGSRTDLS